MISPTIPTEQMLRPCCDDCGAAVRWLSYRQAAAAEEVREYLLEAESFLGLITAVWQCRACGKLGFFGPWEAGL